MKWFKLSSMVLLAGALVASAATPADGKPASSKAGANAGAPSSPGYVPPVLRSSEAPDDAVVTLPGPAPRRAPARATEASIRNDAPAENVHPAAPAPAPAPKAELPKELVKESAIFCQGKIEHWVEADARAVLGASLRHRPAYEDDRSISGTKYAYADPTGRYKELELDFDKKTGHLRTVFAYPWKMTWQECRRLWGANVTSTKANEGRMFYSYLNRRLDVLVGPGGTVISLGLY